MYKGCKPVAHRYLPLRLLKRETAVPDYLEQQRPA